MRKSLHLLVIMSLLVFTANARQVEVSGPDVFSDMYSASMDGDTLVLHSGTYSTSFALPAAKAVTIFAPDTVEAIFTNSITGSGEGNVEGGSLSLEGLIIDNTTSYYVNHSAPGNMELLSWKNCEIKNIARCFLYFNQADSVLTKTSVNNLVLDNCYIHDCNTGNWNMMWTKAPIYNITMTECTFTKNDGVESFYCPRNTYEGESHHFTFKNNTVYQASRDNSRYICNVGSYFTGEESTFDFEDNIIICPESAVAGGLVNASMGMLTSKNNLVVGYSGYNISTILGEEHENEYTLDTLGIAGIGAIWPDPANANFTIYSGISPLATASTTGSVIGASKWLKEAGTLYTLTIGLAADVDSLAGTISGPSGQMESGAEVTLTAAKNYGFRFVKWVDENGTTLSEEASYTFTVDADKKVYAVFDTIPMYKLNLTLEGEGEVVISETGKDGGYEYYEEGTTITLTAKTNPVVDFIFWDYNDANNVKTITFTNADVDVLAVFNTQSFVCGWDFNTVRNTASQSREADWVGQLVDTTDIPVLGMYYTYAGTDPFSGWWNRTEADRPAATFWKYYSTDGTTGDGSRMTGYSYYWQTRISTKGYKDISVKYSLKYSYYGYDQWKLQYSYNNISWETAQTVNISTSWQDFCDTIENTSDKETLYLRITSDSESATHNDIKDVDGTYITDIFVIADALVALDAPQADAPVAVVKSGILNVSKISENAQAGLYSIDGRLVRHENVSSEFSWNVSDLKGVYILKINDYITKVVF